MSRADALFQDLVEGGEAFIDELIAQRTSEELFLDFKQAATKAEHRRLQEDDRKNLAKALSGFGNTAGGVILWGVDCRDSPNGGDIARTKVPIPQVKRFKSWLENAVAGATVPSHVGIRHEVCHTYPDDSGFVATLIPIADHGPLQMLDGRYLMRAASSFVHIPHQLLAGMFGRRPTPQLTIRTSIAGPLTRDRRGLTATAEITLVNSGLGIAEDLFIAVRVDSDPGPESVFVNATVERGLDGLFSGRGRSMTRMSVPGYRFPPGAEVLVAYIELRLPEVISAPLQISLSAGCGNGPTAHQTLHQNQYRLQQTKDQLTRQSQPDPLWLAQRLFGLAEED